MSSLFKYIPGFRSNTRWKKIIAVLYYLVVFLMFFSDWTSGLFLLSGTFLIFKFIELFRIEKKGIPIYEVLLPPGPYFIYSCYIYIYIFK